MAPEILYTVPEAAKLLSIAPKTLTDWLRAGKIRGVKVGRSWRIPESAIDDIAKSGTQKEE
jgi:acetyl-CoA synthetase